MLPHIKRLARAGLLAAALTAGMIPLVPALAQRTSYVQFQPGADGATLNGTVTGQEYFDYVLRARAGQLMSVNLSITGTNGNGSAYFNILPPGSNGEAIFNGSTSPDRYGEVRLPEDGDYTIRVYLLGNDRDTGKTVGYSVFTTIRDSGSNGSAPASSAVRAGQGIFDATGTLPCSQYVGQPMFQCSFGVARDGNGTATVAVDFPDGRRRFISFKNGEAIGADLSQADGNMNFSVDKWGDLYIIRAGNERFEVVEAVVFGG